LEGEPTVQRRRCCLSASRHTIAPAWGAGRMRTSSEKRLRFMLWSSSWARANFNLD